MKLTGLIRTSLLISLLGMTAMIYAQDQRDDAKPQDPRPEATKPAHDDAKPAREQDAKPQDDAKPSKQEDIKPSHNEEKNEKQMDTKPSAQAEHQEKSSEHAQQAGGQ
ncbi:MAG: hypothetical protein WAM78_06790, partial [Candidatus Sulfotelmatobacter sp.]